MEIKKILNSKIIFIEIKGCQYKAKIKESGDEKFIYIFNFNKSFKIASLQKGSKTASFPQVKPHLKEHPTKKISGALKSTTTFRNNLISPLAGKIIKINVEPGQFIKQNQSLVVIESMKMENEIRATCDTFIKNLLISHGDLVKQNQVLMTFDSKGGRDAKAKNSNEQKKV